MAESGEDLVLFRVGVIPEIQPGQGGGQIEEIKPFADAVDLLQASREIPGIRDEIASTSEQRAKGLTQPMEQGGSGGAIAGGRFQEMARFQGVRRVATPHGRDGIMFRKGPSLHAGRQM
jgi:hypothetical protein